jgi:hypothetical protein
MKCGTHASSAAHRRFVDADCAAPPASALSQAQSRRESGVTVEELIAREAIRDTLAQYNTAGDRMRVDDYVLTFTEDGILEAGQTMNGREAIRAWLTAPREAGDASKPKVKFVRHNLTTCKITLTSATTASVRTYFVVFTDIGPDHCGYYLDEFRQAGDRWLIAHRKARTDWVSPESIFVASF